MYFTDETALSAKAVDLISELGGPEWSEGERTGALLMMEEFSIVMRQDFSYGHGMLPYKETALFLCWEKDGEIRFKRIAGWSRFTVQSASVKRTLSYSREDGPAGIVVSVEGYARGDCGATRKLTFSFRWPEDC